MTKRDLVKWLETRAAEARRLAVRRRDKLIGDATDQIYKSIGVDDFTNEVVPLYQEILKKYESYISKISDIEGISLAKYNYKLGYTDLETRYSIKSEFRKIVEESLRINSSEYNKIIESASQEVSKVISTYDTVILTVKNLPTAKDGLEYLKKLGFDVTEIQPQQVKKQLPATIQINVDTNYLLLRKKENIL